MIEVKNVTKRFDGFAALNDATLSVPTGAVLQHVIIIICPIQ